MLDLAPATIRTWETRYGLVVPQRSAGGQRLYSREQVERLRFVCEQLAAGRRPGEAHRLLSERIAHGTPIGARLRVLLAESRHGAGDVLRRLLGNDVFDVLLAAGPTEARELFEQHSPTVVVIDTSDADFDEFATRLRRSGVKVLPLELLGEPLALLAEAPARL
jgi:DNA-binding transcriptional MerR regulator